MKLALLLVALAPAHDRAPQLGLPYSLQAEDGSWSRDAAGSPLAATAAMALVLVAEGHTDQRGSERQRQARALAWIADRCFARSEDDLVAEGEALAALAVSELARAGSRDATAAALRAHARLLETQRPDGTWSVAGHRPGAPAALETTGWAALALHAGPRGEEPDAAILDARTRARAALTSAHGPTAGAFALLLELVDGPPPADLSARFDALFRGPRADQRTALEDLLATAIAFRAGGDLWRSWSRAEAAAIVAAQLREGPRKGLWPLTGDPRGATFESALRIATLQIHYRYDRTVLTRR